MTVSPTPPVQAGTSLLDTDAVHRDAVHLRDDWRCLAAGSPWAAITPCAGRVVLHRAHPAGTGPHLLRTFCVAHETASMLSPDFAAACLKHGWTLPPAALDVPGYATTVPVRYPDGDHYLLDVWGERRRLDPGRVVAIRTALALRIRGRA